MLFRTAALLIFASTMNLCGPINFNGKKEVTGIETMWIEPASALADHTNPATAWVVFSARATFYGNGSNTWGVLPTWSSSDATTAAIDQQGQAQCLKTNLAGIKIYADTEGGTKHIRATATLICR